MFFKELTSHTTSFIYVTQNSKILEEMSDLFSFITETGAKLQYLFDIISWFTFCFCLFMVN